MKKFLSIILCAIFLLQTVVLAEGKNSRLEESAERLTYLGMMSSDMHSKLQTSVKREEFPGYLLTFMKQDNILSADKSYYYDVDVKSPYLAKINRATELGYLKIDIDKMFYPNNLLSYKEAGDAILRAMGYGSILDSKAAESVAANIYYNLLDGVDVKNGTVTVGDLVIMFNNALDEKISEVNFSSSGMGIKTEKTFLEGYFEIYTGKGRIDATPLTSLLREIDCYENEVSIDKTIYQIPDNLSEVEEYLGYWVKFYYCNINGDDTILYFEPEKTNEVVISAKEFVSYSDNAIEYLPEDSTRTKTVRFNKGAYIIYNGILLENYAPSIFDISNGSIELVGDRSGYDLVKIYDYKDVIAEGATQEAIYVKNSDEHYYLEDYEKVIMRDPYGRNLSYKDIKENSVISVGVSEDKSLIIFNVSNKQISGILEKKITDEDGDIWIVDGRKYQMSPSMKPPFSELNAKVTLYLNYLGKIASLEISSSQNWIYGYLVKAYIIEEEQRLGLKIYTQFGDFEDYKAADKFKIDEESVSHKDALRALSYAAPADMEPQDSVQPQLIKYKRNSDGDVIRIDTARKRSGEDEKVSLTQNISNEKRIYMTETGRLFGMWNNEKMDCLLTDDTIIFTVPGNAEEAKSQLSAYSVAKKTALTYQEQIRINSFDTDYEHGAEVKVVCILLDEILKEPESYSFNNLVVVTDKQKVWSEKQENIVSAVTGYEYFTNQEVTLESVWEKDIFEDVEPGDMIRYGYINNRITGIRKDFDLSNFTYASIHQGEGGANWCGDHIYALYCITPAKLVDIANGYMYTSYKPTNKSTVKDCTMMYNMQDMKTFVFDKLKKKMYEIDSQELREYKYSVNPEADVVIYSSYCVPKMTVVYI